MNVSLKSLIARLNDSCRIALEGAAGLCLSRTNYDVEIEHYLLKLIEGADTDLARILRHFQINTSRLNRDLTRALDQLKTGNARTPALSPRLPQWVQEAWMLASIECGESKVRSGHLTLALMSNDYLSRLASEISSEFNRIQVGSLREQLAEITAGSVEASEALSLGDHRDPSVDGWSPRFSGPTGSLDQYTVDLTARAREGRIDPVLGRDFEIRQVVDILTRRRQNNPILTGEAGVGKTAVVEGFAIRIAEGDVPEPLRNVSLRTLDLGLLQAGAGIKGEFENRLKSVIEEVKASPQPIILFIDEAHTMIGAGGQAGQSDAANLLKPALARGEVRTIAATTWAEYKKYFEKDAALARRFQVIKVEEPTEEQAVVMMRGLTAILEKHHQVRILDEAVADAVKLSHRYISGRQLPDKAVSVLDTACARVALGQGATPPAIEDATRRVAQYNVESHALEREAATGVDHAARIAGLSAAKNSEEERLAWLNGQWERERALIGQIRAIRTKLESLAVEKPDFTKNGAASMRVELAQLNDELQQVQGATPLMQPAVTSQTIAEVISGWTGIPIGKMLADDISTVLQLKDRLARRIIGQDQALEDISLRIRTSRANLTDPRRPVGVFLLIGPSGVGKTETALALADVLYGGERNLVAINMSEYQEAHTVSSLKGSPPGYVGYGEGGVLTEAVRRKPYSVILLDEVEKAHPDVLELFYQVFDKGVLEDSEGREIDFKNTVILLTSNVGLDITHMLCANSETSPEPDDLSESLRPALLKVFKPALLGRMTVVPYYPISDQAMREIIKLQLGRIGARLTENHGAQFGYEEEVVTEIFNRCREVESGARNVDHILTRTLLPEMSGAFLASMAEGKKFSCVHIGVSDEGSFSYEISS